MDLIQVLPNQDQNPSAPSQQQDQPSEHSISSPPTSPPLGGDALTTASQHLGSSEYHNTHRRASILNLIDHQVPSLEQINEMIRNNRELEDQFSNVKTHLYCHIVFILVIRIAQISFSGFIVAQINSAQPALIELFQQAQLSHKIQSGQYECEFPSLPSSIIISECDYFSQLKFWIVGFMLSDFIFLAFVSSFYILFQRYLYRYAYFKYMVCTCLLIFNFLFLGYGAYVIAKIPTELRSSDPDLNRLIYLRELYFLQIIHIASLFLIQLINSETCKVRPLAFCRVAKPLGFEQVTIYYYNIYCLVRPRILETWQQSISQ